MIVKKRNFGNIPGFYVNPNTEIPNRVIAAKQLLLTGDLVTGARFSQIRPY